MWDQISGRTSGSNVQLRITDCDNDCSAGEKSSWCNEKKELRFIDTDGNTEKVEGNCTYFATTSKFSDMGFKGCTAISSCT